jgi:hypothetical protein
MTVSGVDSKWPLQLLEANVGHRDQHDKDVRIMYPLRTLPAHADSRTKTLVQTPTNPPLEELVMLVTTSTRPCDVEMFDQFARPILQAHGVSIRLSNVTQLVANALDKDIPASVLQHNVLDSAMRTPKWTSVRELARYVSIYPARCLWILDASTSAAYYASVASVEGARFVVSPAGMPHHANRFIAWNARAHVWATEHNIAT